MRREEADSSIINKVGLGGERTANAFSVFNHPGYHSLSIDNSFRTNVTEFLEVWNNQIIVEVKWTWGYGAGSTSIYYYWEFVVVG